MGRTQQQDSCERTCDGGMCRPRPKDAKGPRPRRDSCARSVVAGGNRPTNRRGVGGGGGGCSHINRNDRRVKNKVSTARRRKPRSVSEDSTSSATSATSATTSSSTSSSSSSSSPEISRARDDAVAPKNHRHRDGGEESSSRSPRRRQQNQQRRTRPRKQSSKQDERRRQRNAQGAVFEGLDLTAEEKSKYVALDCEMVGVAGGEDGGQTSSALARVSIVDWDANVLLDAHVQVREKITDYRTFVSGVRADDLRAENGAMDPDECRLLVAGMLRDKILVGHGLKCDLAALGLTHPWYDVRDTAKYAPFMKPHPSGDYAIPRKLRDLTSQFLHRTIQEEGREHSSVEDAMAAMDLFKAVRVKWEKVVEWKVNRTKEIEEANDRMQQQGLELEAGRTTSPAVEPPLQPQLAVVVQ